MPIADKSKITRPDILNFFEIRENFQTQINEAFFKSVIYSEDDYNPIWEKVGDLNSRWLNGEGVKNVLTMKEKILLAQHLRFYMEYEADYKEQLFPFTEDVIRKPIKANNVPCEWFFYRGAKSQVSCPKIG